MKKRREPIETVPGAALTAALAVFFLSLGPNAGASEAEAARDPDVAVSPSPQEPGARAGASPAPPPSPAPSLAGLSISFKLDPRLAGGTYGGERWVSPPAFTGAAAQDTVEARVEGVGPKGQPVKINPRWTPSDPEMVSVSPEDGSRVRITVKRAGESSLRVTAPGVSSELAINGAVRNGVMQIEIRRLEVKGTAVVPSLQAAPPPKSPAASLPAATVKEAGEAFLAANRTKEGVVTLESGLQYRILKAGEGKQPTPDATVVCQYRRLRLDGTEVDDSARRKKPVAVRLTKAMKGWKEALQLMSVGSKWQLFIPPDLGFGKRGLPRSGIGPNETLVFEVELLAVKEPATGRGEMPPASAARLAGKN